jgi:prepilin-type N-terminal cleavage/methylation domain-containing protein
MTKPRMKKPMLGRWAARAFHGHSRGFTLIEVTIAIALLGIIAVAILAALSTASMALIIADTRATAESLARSQMEYVKNQAQQYPEGYIDYSKSGHDEYDEIEGYNTENYSVDTTVEPIDPTDNKPYPYLEGDGCFQQDVGIQKITVTVSYHTVGAQNREVERQFTLEDYLRRPVA